MLRVSNGTWVIHILYSFQVSFVKISLYSSICSNEMFLLISLFNLDIQITQENGRFSMQPSMLNITARYLDCKLWVGTICNMFEDIGN